MGERGVRAGQGAQLPDRALHPLLDLGQELVDQLRASRRPIRQPAGLTSRHVTTDGVMRAARLELYPPGHRSRAEQPLVGVLNHRSHLDTSAAWMLGGDIEATPHGCSPAAAAPSP